MSGLSVQGQRAPGVPSRQLPASRLMVRLGQNRQRPALDQPVTTDLAGDERLFGVPDRLIHASGGQMGRGRQRPGVADLEGSPPTGDPRTSTG